MVRLLFILLIACSITSALSFIAGYLAGRTHEQLKCKETIAEYFREHETEEIK